uniref:N-myc-interactor n=1 Tax=Magallana gigas TaxID=29159 RepID=K1RBT7_MAGGI
MEDRRGGGQISSIDSVYMSSDDADTMRETRLKTSDVTCSIRVSSLPPNISEELINDFFENTKRSGGGEVECVAHDETKKTAIITFQDPSVVRSVLKKHKTKPLTMDEMQLQIEEHHLTTIESTGKVDVAAVKVTNLPPKIRKLQIELFFENPKKSGSSNGDLEKVDYDEATHCAIVWLKKSEVTQWGVKHVYVQLYKHMHCRQGDGLNTASDSSIDRLPESRNASKYRKGHSYETNNKNKGNNSKPDGDFPQLKYATTTSRGM